MPALSQTLCLTYIQIVFVPEKRLALLTVILVPSATVRDRPKVGGMHAWRSPCGWIEIGLLDCIYVNYVRALENLN